MVNEPDLSAMDPQARRFLAMMGLAAPRDGATSVEGRRQSFDRLMRFSKPPDAIVDTHDAVVPGCGAAIPIRVYAPDASTTPGLVYFHGGGLVAGGLESHDALCRTLAHEAGCRIVAVGYRLAPEHPFPAAILDAVRAVRWVLTHAADIGVRHDAVAVGGDSGGATLATVVCQIMRRRAALRAQVLLCPVLDFGPPSASRRAYGSGYLLDEATMAQDLVHYATRRPLESPRVSPLHATDLAGMPRSVIHTAGFDPLLDEGAAYAARLAEAGVGVCYRCHPALIHHFYALTAMIPAARAALSEIARDIREVLA